MQARPTREADQPAAGLHEPETAKTYFFRDFRVDGSPLRYIRIGRRRGSEIHIRNEMVSHGHAVLRRAREGYVIIDHGSTNGMYIHDRLTTGPVLVTVGLRIWLGPALLIGVDSEGRAPVDGRVVTLSDFCRALVRTYGHPTRATQRLGGKPSREFIRQRNMPAKRRRRR